MNKEDLEWVVEFLENQGFSYYAEKVEEYDSEIIRLNAVIDAYKELLLVAQAKEEILKERLSWKDSTEPVYIVK